MHPFRLSRADDLAQAVAAHAMDGQAAFIAGGTDLLGLMKDRAARPERLLDINWLPNLARIADSPGQRYGQFHEDRAPLHRAHSVQSARCQCRAGPSWHVGGNGRRSLDAGQRVPNGTRQSDRLRVRSIEGHSRAATYETARASWIGARASSGPRGDRDSCAARTLVPSAPGSAKL